MRDGATFVVRRTTFGLNVNVQVLTGELTWPSPNVVRWTTLEARPLAAGNYSVALLGSRDPSPNATTTDTVRSVDGRALDGELWQLPSGDNGDGGNFAFAVQVI